MKLRNDGPLSQAYRYAMHRRSLADSAERERSYAAWIGYIGQFTGEQRRVMVSAYYAALYETKFEDRRTRGRRS